MWRTGTIRSRVTRSLPGYANTIFCRAAPAQWLCGSGTFACKPRLLGSPPCFPCVFSPTGRKGSLMIKKSHQNEKFLRCAGYAGYIADESICSCNRLGNRVDVKTGMILFLGCYDCSFVQYIGCKPYGRRVCGDFVQPCYGAASMFGRLLGVSSY